MKRRLFSAHSLGLWFDKLPAAPNFLHKLLSATILLLMFAAFPSNIHSQQPRQTSPESIDISSGTLQKLKNQTENNKSLDEELRGEILKRCDEALNAVSAVQKFSAQAARYRRDQASVPRLIESLKAQLLSESPVQETTVSESATAADVEQLLQQVGAELAARRESVKEIKQSTSQRMTRRTEINRRAAELDQQIYELDSSIESTAETANEPLLRQATLASLAARRQAAREEMRALNEELRNLNLRYPLRILREQRAERRVVEAIQRTNYLQGILRSKVNAEIAENLSRIRTESAEVLERYPNLKVVTDEIHQIAEQLYGAEGVEKSAEPLTAELTALREALGKVSRAMELAKSKYSALGSRAELQRWVPVVPPDIPTRHVLQEQIRQRAVGLADAKATLIGLQDKLASESDLDTELASILADLNPAAGEKEQAERQSLCRRLLLTRRELLDQLVSQYSDYYSKLSELDAVSKDLLRELDEGYRFILERVFWKRSIGGPLIPPARDVLNAARWLFLNPEWPGSILGSFKGAYRMPVVSLGGLILLILLLRGRERFRQRLVQAGKRADDSEKPLRPLLESALLTFLLAAPIPVALAELGLFIMSPQPALIAEKVGAALLNAALLTLGLELIVQFFREGGFAQIQFALSSDRCRRVQREVRLLMLVFIPSAFVFLSFGGKASDHVGDPIRIAYLESLGRIAFIIAISAVALTSFRLYRWLIHQGRGVFIRFAGAVLAVLGVVCLFAVILSIFGWHLSAFVLAQSLLRSFFLILDIALITAFIERLKQIRNKLLHESESRKLAEQASKSEEELEDYLIADQVIDLEATNRQVGELIRLGAIVATLLGLYLIWSAQMPSLRFLERVQLLPSGQILPANPIAPEPAEISGETALSSKTVSSAKVVSSPKELLMPTVSTSGASEESQVEQTEPGYSLTAAGLLAAIGILLLLTVLAKYLPSLLDFAILSRFRIVSGDRKAITTIFSYILVIIGVSAAAAKMGLRWTQVQWLAAAFSFGLGFGLQDIFANFFSGLVLLFERPMRVGDFCRFGEQLGTVEAIGLRSTKVRGLDRTIINVPNADFSKKELVNYAKRDNFLLRTTIGLRYETTDEQLRYVLAKIRELLLSHPKIAEDPARVRFVGYGDYSLNIEIFAYGIARDWGEFLGIQEDVLLRIMRIIEESGTSFAFPSQTTYLSRDDGLDAARTAAAEAEVQAWRSERNLPFPDFSERQRRRFRNSLDYPPVGSPYTSLNVGPKEDKKTNNEEEK